jgi:uncharacterized protein YbaA (DUF1428 family)
MAWAHVLGDEAATHHRAPARLADFTGLPPTYIEVGELDIFRDESIAYAQRLHTAGISCELHVHPGAPHPEVSMSYVDGFVLAVPTANKEKFLEHARIDSVFIEFGALRVLECWGDDVSRGQQTDFFRAVDAKDDETVVFSWIEWPDKATRDAGMKKMMEDPRMDPAANPMPFDGKRMIYGGFVPVLELNK